MCFEIKVIVHTRIRLVHCRADLERTFHICHEFANYFQNLRLWAPSLESSLTAFPAITLFLQCLPILCLSKSPIALYTNLSSLCPVIGSLREHKRGVCANAVPNAKPEITVVTCDVPFMCPYELCS